MKMKKTPEELLKEREQRFNEAASLKIPDRVPIAPLMSFFTCRYAMITFQEATDEYGKMAMAWKKTFADFQWDMAHVPQSDILPGPVLDILGIKAFKLPGRELPPDVQFQYFEEENMTADEYDQLLANPGEFTIKTLLPRMAKVFEHFKSIPPIHSMADSYAILWEAPLVATTPEFVECMKSLMKAGWELRKFYATLDKLEQELKDLGFPMLFGPSPALSPFDQVSHQLRGMRGSMLDMHRNPDKLLQAIDLYTPLIIENAISGAKMSGNPRVFMPLHRGSKIFMSNEQFEKFYWPSLKKVIVSLIDAGLTPMPLFEGDYTPRLEYLKELPKGKVIAHFDRADIFKAKEILSDHMCIKGNVPTSLLCTGTPRQVEKYCKKLIDIVGEGGGFIMDGACGIPSEAKLENVKAMTETTKKYGVYKR